MQVYEKPISRIASIGVSIPERRVDNKEMASMVDAPWAIKTMLAKLIKRTTGNEERAYSPPGTKPSDLAVDAARDAFSRCSIKPEDIDTIIFSSTDLDTFEPATASPVSAKLGLKCVNCFDVSSACNSVLQAINVSNSLIATGAAEKILIVSGEIGSYVTNKKLERLGDLTVKMGGLTLGDGGAALIMEKTDDDRGILEVNLKTLSDYWECCHVPENIDWREREGVGYDLWFYLDMEGLAKTARKATTDYFTQYMGFRKERYGEEPFDANLCRIVPHQISRKFIEEIGGGLGLDMDKVVITAHRFGNTASTSIPIAVRTMTDEQDILNIGSGDEAFLYGAASGFSIGHVRVKL
ncbi:MAG: ketoacyl-ACP synthase III [Planctomycetes bacterium]|nr:ketoacyl-ACP synthase III [Planctomycetota bacterium]